MPCLSDLQYVNLLSAYTHFSANQIASLADLASCYNLEELYLRRNSINSLMELTHLKSLPRLRVLWLEGSPCTAIPDYRLTVLHLLPQLRRLDNVGMYYVGIFFSEPKNLVDC
jgi:Leucine-rich repeat (LRR) protein